MSGYFSTFSYFSSEGGKREVSDPPGPCVRLSQSDLTECGAVRFGRTVQPLALPRYTVFKSDTTSKLKSLFRAVCEYPAGQPKSLSYFLFSLKNNMNKKRTNDGRPARPETVRPLEKSTEPPDGQSAPGLWRLD